jgi:hypothetical protein
MFFFKVVAQKESVENFLVNLNFEFDLRSKRVFSESEILSFSLPNRKFPLGANGLQAGAEKLGSFKRVSPQRPVLKVKTLFVVCNTSCQP